jgi:beta-galactosidase
VDYVVDRANRFTIVYDYAIRASGELSLRYRVSPTVQAKWLPHVGMELQLAPSLERLRWLGLGPMDAYPNKNVAPILGIWSDNLRTVGTQGTKSVRWAKITGPDGSGISLQLDSYLNYDAAEAGRVQVLSSVLGKPTKRWRPEDPSYRLDTDTGRPFVGEFRLQMQP